MYIKDFDNWSTKKKKLQLINSYPYFKEKQVWWTCIGVNIGDDIDGKGVNFARPVLILKKLNNRLFIGVPLSTKLKYNPFYLSIEVKGQIVSTIISQTKVLSSK